MKRYKLHALKQTGINMGSYVLGVLTMFCVTNSHFLWAIVLGVCWGGFLYWLNIQKAKKRFSSAAEMQSSCGTEAEAKRALILPLAAGGTPFLKENEEVIAQLDLDGLIEFALENNPRWNRLTHLRLLRLHLPVLEVIYLFGSKGERGTCHEVDQWAVFVSKLLERSCQERGRTFEVQIIEPGNPDRPLVSPPQFQASYQSNELQGWDFFNIDALLFLYRGTIAVAVQRQGMKEKDIAIDITSATVTTSLAGTFLSAPGSPANNYINQDDPSNIRDLQWFYTGDS